MALDWLGGAVVGAVTGAVLGFTHYLKNKKDGEDEEFSFQKIGVTLVLSAIAGAGIGASGKVVTDDGLGIALAGLSASGIDQLVQNLFKAGFRKKKK